MRRVFGQGNATGTPLLGSSSPSLPCIPEAVVTAGSALFLPLYFATFPAAGRGCECKGKGKEKRQTANVEVLCRSLNPSCSPQVDQRRLKRSSSLGLERDSLEKTKGRKEMRISRRKTAFLQSPLDNPVAQGVPEMRNSVGEGAAHTHTQVPRVQGAAPVCLYPCFPGFPVLEAAL